MTGHEDSIAPGDRAGDLLSKVCAGRDRVDVSEDGRRTERCREATSDAANQIARAVTAVRGKLLHGSAELGALLAPAWAERCSTS
jgi:hypothetical protein